MQRPALTALALIQCELGAYAADVAPHPEWRNSLAPQGERCPLLTLAQSGRTEYVILLPGRPTGPEQKAAEDLACALRFFCGPVECLIEMDRAW